MQVVLGYVAIGAAVLEQEAGQGGRQHPVLVPLRMGLDERTHALEQGFGHFRLEADAGGGTTWSFEGGLPGNATGEVITIDAGRFVHAAAQFLDSVQGAPPVKWTQIATDAPPASKEGRLAERTEHQVETDRAAGNLSMPANGCIGSTDPELGCQVPYDQKQEIPNRYGPAASWGP